MTEELSAKRDKQMLQLIIEHPFITNKQASNMGIGSPTKQSVTCEPKVTTFKAGG